MEHYTLGAVEHRFAAIVWAHAPLPSGELVRLCQEELQWKKSTTYTVLKKLCQKGFFQNEGGEVRVLVTEAEYDARESHQFLSESFHGSLPAFLAAFSQGGRLTEEELQALQALIDAQRR